MGTMMTKFHTCCMVLMLFGFSQAFAQTIAWSGTIERIEVNTGGLFNASIVGDQITGEFVYGNSADDGVVIPELITSTFYNFSGSPFKATLANQRTGISTSQSLLVQMNIFNNDPVGDADAQRINIFSGSANTQSGEPIDAWIMESNTGATTPEWFIALIDLLPGVDLYSNTDFQVNPPELNTIDLAAFEIEQDNEIGQTIFLASGTINSITINPNSQSPEANSQYSGTWFDPSHNGEGFVVEILKNEQAVIYWYTYDQNGNQAWIFGVGSISNKIITVDEAIITSGGIFGPSFDPNTVERNIWGNLSIEFTSCTTAIARYQSTTEQGFGSGQQQLSRLTSLAGLAC